jgi:enoyl-CoA hydratase/carnithine racemase
MKRTRWSISCIAIPDPAIVLDVPWFDVNIGGWDKVMSVVSVEQRGPVAIVAIDRPEKLNAIAESAKFSYPEGKVGLTGGMIAGLAARIPHKIAMELMLLGEPITARRAYEAGLANRVVPDGAELEEAIAMAQKIVDLARWRWRR